MKNFYNLYEAGAVKRWHTKVTIKEQDLAAHSWGVAMIVAQIAPGNAALMEEALTHDLHESELGDIPYPVKRKYAMIKKAGDAQNNQFCHDHEIHYTEHPIIKWADMFELLLWCWREFDLGNTHVVKTIDVAEAALESMGFPNDAAKKLFEEVHNARGNRYGE